MGASKNFTPRTDKKVKAAVMKARKDGGKVDISALLNTSDCSFKTKIKGKVQTLVRRISN